MGFIVRLEDNTVGMSMTYPIIDEHIFITLQDENGCTIKRDGIVAEILDNIYSFNYWFAITFFP